MSLIEHTDVDLVTNLVFRQGEEVRRLRKELQESRKIHAASIEALLAAERRIETLQKDSSQWRIRLTNMTQDFLVLQVENDAMLAELDATRGELVSLLNSADFSVVEDTHNAKLDRDFTGGVNKENLEKRMSGNSEYLHSSFTDLSVNSSDEQELTSVQTMEKVLSVQNIDTDSNSVSDISDTPTRADPSITSEPSVEDIHPDTEQALSSPFIASEPIPVFSSEPELVTARVASPTAASASPTTIAKEPTPVVASAPPTTIAKEPTPVAVSAPPTTIAKEPTPVAASAPPTTIAKEPTPVAASAPPTTIAKESTPVAASTPPTTIAREPTPVATTAPPTATASVRSLGTPKAPASVAAPVPPPVSSFSFTPDRSSPSPFHLSKAQPKVPASSKPNSLAASSTNVVQAINAAGRSTPVASSSQVTSTNVTSRLSITSLTPVCSSLPFGQKSKSIKKVAEYFTKVLGPSDNSYRIFKNTEAFVAVPNSKNQHFISVSERSSNLCSDILAFDLWKGHVVLQKNERVYYLGQYGCGASVRLDKKEYELLPEETKKHILQAAKAARPKDIQTKEQLILSMAATDGIYVAQTELRFAGYSDKIEKAFRDEAKIRKMA
ncbi:hypothetical protein D9757_010617 [Collybiopsis confluens]|uniref:Uncharacterized protein n=1 Tax=Collybiopsis confluens TaxID=2823264 RepID=A0A8H5GSG2_9AGAR|nr:hypothetical protein D9757_010617 [Collybiopsis confluens]